MRHRGIALCDLDREETFCVGSRILSTDVLNPPIAQNSKHAAKDTTIFTDNNVPYRHVTIGDVHGTALCNHDDTLLNNAFLSPKHISINRDGVQFNERGMMQQGQGNWDLVPSNSLAVPMVWSGGSSDLFFGRRTLLPTCHTPPVKKVSDEGPFPVQGRGLSSHSSCSHILGEFVNFLSRMVLNITTRLGSVVFPPEWPCINPVPS